jgi:hypothetical protein
VIAWGDVPTWLGVIGAGVAAVAALRQLSLQREQLREQQQQLREQQRVLAQRVFVERRAAYSQLLRAMGDWDRELRFALDHPALAVDRQLLDSKHEAARKALAEVEQIGSSAVAARAAAAFAEFDGVSAGLRAATHGLFARKLLMEATMDELGIAIRSELAVPEAAGRSEQST